MTAMEDERTRGLASRRPWTPRALPFEAPGATGARSSEAKSQARSNRAWLWFSVGLTLLLLGFLVGPRVIDSEQQSTCVGNVQFPGPFGISLNCDSPQFMWLARDPAGLLAENNARQARPGLIAAAALLTAPLWLVVPASTPRPVDAGLRDPAEITASFARDLPAYIAYVLLNIALLAASFFILRKLLNSLGAAGHFGAAEMSILVSAGLLLVANDVTKAFVWSPHTQMFNMLVPVLAVYATLRTWSGALADWRFATAMGIAAGLGMTAYPVFVVIPVCCLPPALVMIARTHLPSRRRRAIAGLALLLGFGALPSLLWYLAVRLTTGDFFHYEVAQGEVVWMAGSWAKGAGVLLYDLLHNAWVLFAAAMPQATAIILFAALTGWVTFAKGASLRPAYPFMTVGLYVSIAMLGFYACVGWLVDRLAYPILPPLLAAAAAAAIAVSQQLDERDRPRFATAISILALAQMVYVIAKDGPWS